MNSPLTAGDIMTRSVATTTLNASLPTAISLMLERHVSGLPVLDEEGVLVGILTEGDLLRRVELGTNANRAPWLDFFRGSTRLAHDYVETHSRIVGDIMTSGVVTADAAAPLLEVVRLMQGKRIKCVPVLAGTTLVGIVSRADLLHALAKSLAETTGDTPPTDAMIRAGILAEFGRQSWAPVGGSPWRSRTALWTLEALSSRESERAAMRVAAENIFGVKVSAITWSGSSRIPA